MSSLAVNWPKTTMHVNVQQLLLTGNHKGLQSLEQGIGSLEVAQVFDYCNELPSCPKMNTPINMFHFLFNSTAITSSIPCPPCILSKTPHSILPSDALGTGFQCVNCMKFLCDKEKKTRGRQTSIFTLPLFLLVCKENDLIHAKNDLNGHTITQCTLSAIADWHHKKVCYFTLVHSMAIVHSKVSTSPVAAANICC